MFRLTFRAILGLVLIALLSGCATIVGGGSNQAVTLQSTPPGASFIIQSSSGIQMAQGETPSTVRLPRKNEYQVQLTMSGYQPQTTALTRGTNGWIWGNLVVGWLVGFVVDFATGSAYKLEPSLVQVTLQQTGDETFAVVRLLDGEEVIDEKKRLMIPSK